MHWNRIKDLACNLGQPFLFSQQMFLNILKYLPPDATFYQPQNSLSSSQYWFQDRTYGHQLPKSIQLLFPYQLTLRNTKSKESSSEV